MFTETEFVEFARALFKIVAAPPERVYPPGLADMRPPKIYRTSIAQRRAVARYYEKKKERKIEEAKKLRKSVRRPVRSVAGEN